MLEPELNARLVAEVALVLVSACESVAKPGKNVIDLRRAEGDGVRKRNIDTAAEHEVKCVVTRIVDDAGHKLVAEVAVKARVGAAKQCFSKRFEMSRAELTTGPTL